MTDHTASLTMLALCAALNGVPCEAGATRIVGGTSAAKGQYKFFTSVDTAGKGSYVCGGSLIHKKWALTAAHCTRSGKYRVRVSAYNRQYDAASEELRAVTKKVPHPQFSGSDYDFVLLGWRSPVVKATPIALSDGNAFEANPTALTTIGLGYVSAKPIKLPDALQQVVLEYVEPADCTATPAINAEIMICAGNADIGKGAYRGDDGGPLFFTESGVYKQVGVLSWADASVGRSVFAKLSADVLSFIQATAK